MGSKLDTKINEICELLKNNPSTIFCGAGISADSGLPLGFGADGLIPYVIKSLGFNDKEQEMLIHAKVPFESIVESMARGGGLEPLLQLFALGQPNYGHDFVAKMILNGYTDTVCTTNYDLLFERALEKYEVNYNRLFHDMSFKIDDWNRKIPSLLKLHGSIDEMESVSITLSRVANKFLGGDRQIAINHSFTSKDINDKYRVVLVLGYSCSDVFDITPAIKRVKDKFTKVIYINHTNDLDEYSCYDSKECLDDSAKLRIIEKENNPFSEFNNTLWIRVNTNRLLEELSKKLSFDNSSKSIYNSKINWREFADRWIISHTTEMLAMRRIVMLENVLELNATLDRVDELSFTDNRTRAAILHRLGRFDEAIEQYNEALAYNLEHPLIVANTLSNYGKLYTEMEKSDLAIPKFQEALKILKEYPSKEELLRTKRGLANALWRTGDIESALTIGEEACAIAEEIGNPKEIACCRIMLAQIYLRLNEFDKMSFHNDEAERLSELTGDIYIQGTALLNKGMFLQNSGRVEFMMRNDEKGIELQHQAIALFSKAIGLLKRFDVSADIAKAMYAYADSLTGIPEQIENSIIEFKNAANVAEECGFALVEGRAYQAIGEILLMKLNKPQEALVNLMKSMDVLSRINEERWIATSLGQLFATLLVLYPSDKAEKEYLQIHRNYPKIRKELIEYSKNMGQLLYSKVKN